jgi:hypothetical protein
VIVNSRFRQRRQVLTSSGVLVEIFLNPENESRRQFREENYQAMHMVGYGLIDRYEDALDVPATDPARADPALWRVLDQAIVLRYRLARRWCVKTKRLLADLEKWDPALATLASAFYGAASPAKRKDILDQVLRHVLGPEDSLKIEPWESVPEDVSG